MSGGLTQKHLLFCVFEAHGINTRPLLFSEPGTPKPFTMVSESGGTKQNHYACSVLNPCRTKAHTCLMHLEPGLPKLLDLDFVCFECQARLPLTLFLFRVPSPGDQHQTFIDFFKPSASLSTLTRTRTDF